MVPLKKIVGFALFLLGLLLAGGLLRRHLAALDWGRVHIRPLWLFLAFATNLAYVGLYARLWRKLAETGGLRLPATTARGISFCALAYKYLPVRVAGIGYRTWAYRKLGGWPLAMISAVLYSETALALFSGGCVALLLSPWVRWKTFNFGTTSLLFVCGALLSLWMLPAVVSRLARLHANWFWLHQAATVAQTSFSPALLVRYASAWIVLGSSLWFTLAALSLNLSAENYIVCIWAYAFAGLAGMLALFAPAGLGVREGVLAMALSGVLPPPTAALAALAARILIVSAEALCAVLGHQTMQKVLAKHRPDPA